MDDGDLVIVLELLEKAVASGLPGNELAAFGAWLRTGGVDRKRQDACAMLRVMADLLAANPQPLAVDYDFEHTSAWDEMVRHEAALAAFHERGARLPLEILLKTLDETDYP